MKIIIYIFTLYMFALSLVPCGDGESLLDIANHLFGTTHQHLSDHEQHDKNCGDDSCSPFCICSCCSSPIDIPVEIPLQIKSLSFISAKVSSFISHIIPSSFHTSIWQPPRFS